MTTEQKAAETFADLREDEAAAGKTLTPEEEAAKLSAAIAAEGGEQNQGNGGDAPKPPPSSPEAPAAPPPAAAGPKIDGAAAFDPEAARARYKATPYEAARWPRESGSPGDWPRVFEDREVKVLRGEGKPKTAKEKKNLQTTWSKWLSRMVEYDREQHELRVRVAKAQGQAAGAAAGAAEPPPIYTGREPYEGVNTGIVVVQTVVGFFSEAAADRLSKLLFKERQIANAEKAMREAMNRYPTFGRVASFFAIPWLRASVDFAKATGENVRDYRKAAPPPRTIDVPPGDVHVGPVKPPEPTNAEDLVSLAARQEGTS